MTGELLATIFGWSIILGGAFWLLRHVRRTKHDDRAIGHLRRCSRWVRRHHRFLYRRVLGCRRVGERQHTASCFRRRRSRHSLACMALRYQADTTPARCAGVCPIRATPRARSRDERGLVAEHDVVACLGGAGRYCLHDGHVPAAGVDGELAVTPLQATDTGRDAAARRTASFRSGDHVIDTSVSGGLSRPVPDKWDERKLPVSGMRPLACRVWRARVPPRRDTEGAPP